MQDPNINTFSPTPAVNYTGSSLSPVTPGGSICVIGSGAFGGWSALHLLRKGYKVTLIDAWGPGNSRASSGDETRVIRSTYGSNELYFRLNVRATQLWREHELESKRKLFYNTGVLWLCYRDNNPIVDDSIPFSIKYGTPYEKLSVDEIRSRYPEINTSDLMHGYFDPFGGYLKARESCQSVLEKFLEEGGTFIQANAVPKAYRDNKLTELLLSNGSAIRNDAYLFACGSWLPFLFPEILTAHIHCTKQEVYYFGVPPGASKSFDNLPVWVDLDGEDFYYGIPGNAGRGFKIGVDRRGETFNPTVGERTIDPDVIARARAFLHHRFPSLRNAPLVENRICPYENSVTGNFIFDQHPSATNVFFLGGGSGHGFKHGPALGELVAACLSGQQIVPELFRIAYP